MVAANEANGAAKTNGNATGKPVKSKNQLRRMKAKAKKNSEQVRGYHIALNC
jgi:hypothetical protein